MIFDKESNGADGRIVSDHKVQYETSNDSETQYVAAKLNYGISVDKSAYKHIKHISWKVLLSTPNKRLNWRHFIGVVSNRTKDLNACPWTPRYRSRSGPPKKPLVDAYGISAGTHGNTFIGTGKRCFNELHPGYAKGEWVTVKYLTAESKLIFENEMTKKSFEMQLPTDIDGITEWYPAIGLRYPGDGCEIKDIVVE